MVRTVFSYIENAGEHIDFIIKVSMIEIYMEKIRDLLEPKNVNLLIKEDKNKRAYVANVTESFIEKEDEVLDIMNIGNRSRKVAATKMNAESSRSHSIFILTVTQNNRMDLSCKTGKLYLVDLAGSERADRTE